MLEKLTKLRKVNKTPEQAFLNTLSMALFWTLQFGVWLDFGLSAGGTIGRYFCLLLTFCAGTLAVLNGWQAITLWKLRNSRQEP